jgi:hypothetical protein
MLQEDEPGPSKILVEVHLDGRSDVAVVGSDGSYNGVGNAVMSKEKAIKYARGLKGALQIPVVLKDSLHIN